MSGGSLDYLYGRVHDAAASVRRHSAEREDKEILQSFADHLDKVAVALQAVEWDFSMDSSLDEKDYDLIRGLVK